MWKNFEFSLSKHTHRDMENHARSQECFVKMWNIVKHQSLDIMYKFQHRNIVQNSRKINETLEKGCNMGQLWLCCKFVVLTMLHLCRTPQKGSKLLANKLLQVTGPIKGVNNCCCTQQVNKLMLNDFSEYFWIKFYSEMKLCTATGV